MDRIITARGMIISVVITGMLVTIGITVNYFSSTKEKRPVVVEVESPPTFEAMPQRLAEIINTSKNNSLKKHMNYLLLDEVAKETGAKCEARETNCYNFFTRLLNEKEITIALKTISRAGVKIYVWPNIDGRDDRERIYIDDDGRLIIRDNAEVGQLKDFLGIKQK